MPIYKGRRPGTHRVVIWLKGKPLEWIVEGNRGDARQFELDKRVELRAKAVTASRRELTFSELCRERYEPHAAIHLGANTWNNDRVYQVATLKEHFGKLRLSEVGSRIDSYKKARLAGGMQASTLNLHLKVLRAILNWAVGEKLLSEAPKVKLLPEGERRVHWWRLEDVATIYRTAREKHAWMVPILHFMLETGCRKGEVIAAEWSWVDWAAQELRIPVTRFWRPKSRKPREVPLSPALLATLRKLQKDAGPIFPRPDGKPYEAFPKDAWNRMTEEAGLRCGPHTTRHTFASHFLAKVPDLQLLSKLMGHSHTMVTERYAHMLPDRFEKARGVVSMAPTMATRPKARKTPRKTG